MVFLCEELFREAAGFPGVALVGDVVAVEDAARPVPRDFHVHRFGDSRSTEISDGSPSQIVEEQTGHGSRGSASLRGRTGALSFG